MQFTHRIKMGDSDMTLQAALNLKNNEFFTSRVKKSKNIKVRQFCLQPNQQW